MARARSCCWPVRRAWERRGSPPRWPPVRERSCSRAAPAAVRRRRTRRWWPRCGRACGPTRPRSTASAPLRPHLALLLPELGDPAPASDAATVSEAVRGAFAHLAREQTVLLLLDDLQWSDDATLELLATLAEPLGQLRILVVAGYRSDGLPRDHVLRHLRHELRRDGRLEELTLAPLALSETGELLAGILGDAPSPAIARAIHERARGVPFFVEELAQATERRDGPGDDPRRGADARVRALRRGARSRPGSRRRRRDVRPRDRRRDRHR